MPDVKKLQAFIAECLYDFPAPNIADPNGQGIIALGADLSATTLLSAYSKGLFPWFNDDDEPIAWWSPDPRCIVTPAFYQPSKSLKKQAKKQPWQLTINQAFKQVVTCCSQPRSYSNETWITENMQTAYQQLHEHGFAHSIEVWDENNQLIGGLYGIKVGAMFCGESMFHTKTDASKLAFWYLNHICINSKVAMIDCQLPNDHLLSLGATTLARDTFLTQLDKLVMQETESWQTNKDQWQLSSQHLHTTWCFQAE